MCWLHFHDIPWTYIEVFLDDQPCEDGVTASVLETASFCMLATFCVYTQRLNSQSLSQYGLLGGQWTWPIWSDQLKTCALRYIILCECSKVYVGQRSLLLRWSVRNTHGTYSDFNHTRQQWQGTASDMDCLVKEAMEIWLHLDIFNRDMWFVVPGHQHS